MKRFEVYELSLQVVAAIRGAHTRIRQRDRELAIQIKRSASSIPANIAEGARRHGADRLHHYRVAAGSASELRSHLATALAWGDLDPSLADPPLAICDCILAMLWRLTHP